MSPKAVLQAALPSLCVALVWACGSDPQPSSIASDDAGPDLLELDAPQADSPDASQDGATSQDVATEVPVEAGPTSCTEPCSASCASHGPVQGECASCVGTVCGAYNERAENAPSRTEMLACMDGCGTKAGCADDCCNKYSQACAWEVAFELCSCGFKQDSCAADCTESCSSKGLTQACGVCASESPCSMATFDYLFASNRSAHQDCVDTCTSSSLTQKECLDRCRNDYPKAGSAYDAFLSCVCP